MENLNFLESFIKDADFYPGSDVKAYIREIVSRNIEAINRLNSYHEGLKEIIDGSEGLSKRALITALELLYREMGGDA